MAPRVVLSASRDVRSMVLSASLDASRSPRVRVVLSCDAMVLFLDLNKNRTRSSGDVGVLSQTEMILCSLILQPGQNICDVC